METLTQTPQVKQPQQPEIKHVTFGGHISEKKFEGYENVFVANSGQPDAVKDVVNVAGMDLSRFQKNGVVFYQHDGYYAADPDKVIAKGTVWKDGEALMLGITAWDTNELATEVRRKVDEGFINGASIGFIEKQGRYSDDDKTYVIEKSELLEVSVVNIPADPKAVKVKSIVVDQPGEIVDDPIELTPDEIKKKRVDTFLFLNKNKFS
jgi:HK97 family phage prohead protease